ncbi:MAG TPA: thioredoxin family protein [Rhodocyclaceae bacterium]|nr:thioredoxin family protein [Rhodocyclaceae bacterium]
MTDDFPYTEAAPTREEVDVLSGAVVLNFGTNWCGFCRAAQPLIRTALAEHAGVLQIKVEDGSGRRLGRSFAVKLWPTLVFLRDGKELARVVRPQSVDEVEQGLAKIEAD